MDNVDPRILAKIKKCLALAGSPNPNEAAVAMRQARALMEKHGVEASQVTMAEIGEATADIRTMARDKPARWEVSLAAMVGKAFGCQLLVGRDVLPKQYRAVMNSGRFVFIGLKAQAEIAAYTVSVLSRKCKAARAAFIAERVPGLPRARKTRVGDAFAEGWVGQIAQLVTEFANPPEVEKAISEYTEKSKTSDDDAPMRATNTAGLFESLAARHGAQAAKGESIYRPMNARAPQMAIGMEGGAR